MGRVFIVALVQAIYLAVKGSQLVMDALELAVYEPMEPMPPGRIQEYGSNKQYGPLNYIGQKIGTNV
jgi:hypothetical protein